MPVSDFFVGQYLKQRLQLCTILHISFELLAVILMHLMYDRLPSYFILLPPLFFSLLHLVYHTLTVLSLRAVLLEIYFSDLCLWDLFEEALEGVKLLPVLDDQWKSLELSFELLDLFLNRQHGLYFWVLEMLGNVDAEILVWLKELLDGGNILWQVDKFETSRLDGASLLQAFIYCLEKALKLLLALSFNFWSFGL